MSDGWGTTYITVACVSDKRWFDMDSERTAHVNGTQNPATRGYGGYADKPQSDGTPCHPAGAPLLDCWFADKLPPDPPRVDPSTLERQDMSEARFLIGDVFDRMADIPDGSIDLIVTSPPFLALRSYLPADHPDKGKEIGSEPTPAAFLTTLLALTREWRRILTPTGSLCVELGDTYSGSVAFDGTDDFSISKGRGKMVMGGTGPMRSRKGTGWPLDKSLCLIPSLFAGSLAYGRNLLNPDDRLEPWRVRNLIVWHRPNPPVGALGDKVRPSTSYITTACVSDKRWFDLDSERTPFSEKTNQSDVTETNGSVARAEQGGRPRIGPQINTHAGAPLLDCWTIPTAPYAGAHYATFPPAIPRRLINLMCPRSVCLSCGEPRRRFGNSGFGLQTELAAHIRERRTALGLHPDDVNGWFGYKEIARNWERTDPYGAAVPNAKDWPTLKERLDLDDRFDSFVMSRGPDHIEYDNLGSLRRDRAERIHESPRPVFNKATRIAPDEWSDCGHNTWRRGIVCDPFAGSGTTLQAASELGRDSIGIDLDTRNLSLARQRLGMFLVEEETVP